MAQYTFVEFFAGGGMARAGLGDSWRCLFANDFDPKKVSTYEANWGAGDIKHGDVASLTLADLPATVDRPRVGFLSLPGPFARRGLSRPGSGTRQCPDPFGHILALLETDARPRAS